MSVTSVEKVTIQLVQLVDHALTTVKFVQVLLTVPYVKEDTLLVTQVNVFLLEKAELLLKTKMDWFTTVRQDAKLVR